LKYATLIMDLSATDWRVILSVSLLV